MEGKIQFIIGVENSDSERQQQNYRDEICHRHFVLQDRGICCEELALN